MLPVESESARIPTQSNSFANSNILAVEKVQAISEQFVKELIALLKRDDNADYVFNTLKKRNAIYNKFRDEFLAKYNALSHDLNQQLVLVYKTFEKLNALREVTKTSVVVIELALALNKNKAVIVNNVNWFLYNLLTRSVVKQIDQAQEVPDEVFAVKLRLAPCNKKKITFEGREKLKEFILQQCEVIFRKCEFLSPEKTYSEVVASLGASDRYKIYFLYKSARVKKMLLNDEQMLSVVDKLKCLHMLIEYQLYIDNRSDGKRVSYLLSLLKHKIEKSSFLDEEKIIQIDLHKHLGVLKTREIRSFPVDSLQKFGELGGKVRGIIELNNFKILLIKNTNELMARITKIRESTKVSTLQEIGVFLLEDYFQDPFVKQISPVTLLLKRSDIIAEHGVKHSYFSLILLSGKNRKYDLLNFIAECIARLCKHWEGKSPMNYIISSSTEGVERDSYFFESLLSVLHEIGEFPEAIERNLTSLVNKYISREEAVEHKEAIQKLLNALVEREKLNHSASAGSIEVQELTPVENIPKKRKLEVAEESAPKRTKNNDGNASHIYVQRTGYIGLREEYEELVESDVPKDPEIVVDIDQSALREITSYRMYSYPSHYDEEEILRSKNDDFDFIKSTVVVQSADTNIRAFVDGLFVQWEEDVQPHNAGTQNQNMPCFNALNMATHGLGVMPVQQYNAHTQVASEVTFSVGSSNSSVSINQGVIEGGINRFACNLPAIAKTV